MAMQWLLKIFEYIIFCGNVPPVQYYARDNEVFRQTIRQRRSSPPRVQSATTSVNKSSNTLPSNPSPSVLSQSTRPPPIAQLSPALAATNIPSKASPSPGPSKKLPPPRVQSATTSVNKSSNTLPSNPSPSALSQSTRPPLIAQLSPALAATNIPSKASPSPGLSKKLPPPIAHSSINTTLQSRATTSRAPTLEAYTHKSSDPLVSKQKELAREEARASTTLPPKLENRDTHAKHLKSFLQRYEIPEHLKELIQRGKVPPVLLGEVSPTTYEDYFACLLYAEDYYIEKWSEFLLSEVTLELHSRTPYENGRAIRETRKKVQMNKKDFVAFAIDSIPERLPFLLSRDFVFVRPYGKNKLLKGIIFRVVKRVVLVEFEDDFHAQHTSTNKYDVSFSFNRVCLKRAHRAVSAAKDPSFHDILFPERRFTSSFPLLSLPSRILNHEGPSPYLLEGPLSTSLSGQLSVIGSLIQDATLKIYQNVSHSRILICAPRNQTCDALMRSLQNVIPRSKLFRANAAFRDYDLVPDDIIPACLYEGECFTCPPLNELQDFKVVTSTFMSSFRLHNAGISAEHFTHIFLVDASSATEPETIVALADLVSKKTVIVVSGSSTDIPRYIRSDIARMQGLRKSYFNRLLGSEPYSRRNPEFITHLKGSQ